MYFLVWFTSSHYCLIMNDIPGLKSLLVLAERRILITPYIAHVRKKTAKFLKTILSSSFRSISARFISPSSPIIKHI